MKQLLHYVWLGAITIVLVSCDSGDTMRNSAEAEVVDGEYERGPNNGRLMVDGDFALELAIFETGVPPEYRAWGYSGDEVLAPGSMDLTVTLTRLSDVRDVINFNPEETYLRGDTVIYEPHSFLVAVEASHQNRQHRWEFESFEGRTAISPAMAEAFGLKTDIAGPATLVQTISVIGETMANPELSRQIVARFDGLIQTVYASVGQRVSKGQRLITIESNSSLQPYTINAPISGTILRRLANAGEQTSGRILLEILDTSQVWAELAVHPSQRSQVEVGMSVTISSPIGKAVAQGTIANFDMTVRPDQSIIARALIDNKDNSFAPGTFVQGQIETGQIEAPLAVKRSGLQPFRDFTVVFAKIGDSYEVRMLELGRQDDEWVEVLGGLQAGTIYVTSNSYILKADVEKSGASHDH